MILQVRHLICTSLCVQLQFWRTYQWRMEKTKQGALVNQSWGNRSWFSILIERMVLNFILYALFLISGRPVDIKHCNIISFRCRYLCRCMYCYVFYSPCVYKSTYPISNTYMYSIISLVGYIAEFHSRV